MSRRHRVQYPDAIYHVASRGVNRADIFWDDEDRQCFLERMSQTVAKFGWLVYAFALMTNHFHWFFRTPDPDLCRGMQYLLRADCDRTFRPNCGRRDWGAIGRFDRVVGILERRSATRPS